MRTCLIAVSLLTIFCSSAIAGDEVDYSAPYLTLENGELVTKYPNKEHLPGEEPARPSAEIGAEPGSATSQPQWPVIAVAAIVIIAALLLLRRSGQQRQAAGQDSTD